jgi:hypothetical protein
VAILGQLVDEHVALAAIAWLVAAALSGPWRAQDEAKECAARFISET